MACLNKLNVYLRYHFKNMYLMFIRHEIYEIDDNNLNFSQDECASKIIASFTTYPV